MQKQYSMLYNTETDQWGQLQIANDTVYVYPSEVPQILRYLELNKLSNPASTVYWNGFEIFDGAIDGAIDGAKNKELK